MQLYVDAYIHLFILQNKCGNFTENLNFQESGVKSTQSTSNRKKPTEDATTLMETYLQLANNPGENLCFVNTNLQMLRSLRIFQWGRLYSLFSSDQWELPVFVFHLIYIYWKLLIFYLEMQITYFTKSLILGYFLLKWLCGWKF